MQTADRAALPGANGGHRVASEILRSGISLRPPARRGAAPKTSRRPTFGAGSRRPEGRRMWQTAPYVPLAEHLARELGLGEEREAELHRSC